MGDKGSSTLLNGVRVRKNNPVFGALGDLDELNANLGWVKILASKEQAEMLEKIQNDVYKLMSNIAGSSEGVGETDLEILEKWIGEHEIDVSEFVVPGGDELSVRFHICRTVCRRAERSSVDFLEGEDLKYLNRLSDLLYVMGVA